MSSPVICPACDARLKIPPGVAAATARCPRCSARVDLAAALAARAYQPVAAESPADPPAAPSRQPPPPLPLPEPEDDPLPYSDLKAAARRPTDTPTPPLSLDDDPPPAGGDPTPAAAPFRLPARVTADSAGLFTGPCEAVLVPHGLFLESVPYRPFLYAPVGSAVDTPGRRDLAVTLADGRAVTVRLAGWAGRVAADAAAFLAGERGVPDPGEYRRTPRWLLAAALALAAGLAVGPVVLAHTADLGVETGLLVGAGFAAAGLLANAAVVFLTRLPAVVKVGAMAGVGALVTGVFLLAAAAYLAGRRDGIDLATPPPSDPGPTAPGPQPKAPPKPPDPARDGLPTAIDAAYQDGVYRFADGPDATAAGVTPDGAALVVGYKTGETRVWRFDQLTIDPFAPGPRADGPVTAVRFDATSALVYLACTGGTVAAFWADPPDAPVKIPGEPFAAFTAPAGERFAAARPGALALRSVPVAALRRRDPKAKGFTVLNPKDEAVPADVKAQLLSPGPRPTFLAWHPTGQLLAGQPDGSILSWGANGPGYSVLTREHKAPVRAWAACPGTWDFATGDEKGMVGLWADKATAPRMFTAAAGPITQLSFSPSGRGLAVLGGGGVVWVWDLAEMRAVVKATRPTPITVLAYGPQDDLLILGDGKTLELWHRDELAKQP
ncbi:MAG: hypothetical protein C0501_10010 [Isosphaera sp.]|nr:hypothetical protein [Isosphaera sp.]